MKDLRILFVKLTLVLSLPLAITLAPNFSWGAFYKYSQLRMLNLDQMRQKVQARIGEARTLAEQGRQGEQEAVEKLRDALHLILSRPDTDNMVEKLIPPVRKELENFNAFHDTLASLSSQAVYSVTQGKEDVIYRATNVFVLENILAEFRPEVENNKEIENVFRQIRDAKIKVPKRIVKHRRQSMFNTTRLSQTADEVLKRLEKKRAKEKAKAEATDD